MSVEVMASRYAGALCEAVDEEELDSVLESLRALEQGFEPYMESLFRNPNVSEERQLSVIEKVFDGRGADTLERFCKLLVRKGRFRWFSDIVEAFEQEANDRLGRKPARVETPFDLKDNQQDAIRRQLSQLFDADIVIDEENRPELLAGLRVRVDDYRMDYSVSQQLQELRSRLSTS